MIILKHIVAFLTYLGKLLTAVEDNKRKDKEIKQLRLRLRKMEKFYKENVDK
jgi:hypothetical protein